MSNLLSNLIASEKLKREAMSEEERAEYDELSRVKLLEAVRSFERSMPRISHLADSGLLKAISGYSNRASYVSSLHRHLAMMPKYADSNLIRAINRANELHNQWSSISRFTHFAESFAKQFRFLDIVDNLSETFLQAQKKLWRNGWMIHQNMPITALREIVESKEATQEEIDEALMEYFTAHLEEIESELAEHFPKREKAIKDAFKAHKEKLYFASVPLLLTLSDGIFGDIVGLPQGLYGKDRKTRKRTAVDGIKACINNGTSQIFVSTFLHILDEIGPVNADTSERGQFTDPFNRHLVLHGHDTEYGIEMNSLKAISLLNFVGIFLIKYQQKPAKV